MTTEDCEEKLTSEELRQNELHEKLWPSIPEEAQRSDWCNAEGIAEDERAYFVDDIEEKHYVPEDMDAETQDGKPLWWDRFNMVRKLTMPTDEKTSGEGEDQDKASQVRVPIIDEQGRAYGTGRRKTSTARVWISQGNQCEFKVNGKPFAEYFTVDYIKEDVLAPFVVTNQLGKFHVQCNVIGGGIAGQAGAIRHGLSRALQNFNPEWRPALKQAGYLTRDPRMVERKKPGQAKARKKFQWVKR